MTALVTGAGKRLGRAMALYLAGRGHDVAVHYASSADEAETVVAEIRAMGRRAQAFQADLLDEAQVQALVPGRLGEKLHDRLPQLADLETVLPARQHSNNPSEKIRTPAWHERASGFFGGLVFSVFYFVFCVPVQAQTLRSMIRSSSSCSSWGERSSN